VLSALHSSLIDSLTATILLFPVPLFQFHLLTLDLLFYGTRGAVMVEALRYKLVGSNPDGVIGFFH
jgi:hypothetical protein